MDKFNWMPILRTGNFTDKNGQLVNINTEKLDEIIENSDLSKEPQFVIEHPRMDSIGFGTISKLKRVGDFLLALPKEVNGKFKIAVNAGKLPGRSVTLDKKNYALKNISFLPPEIAPAVSGLGTYNFSKADDKTEEDNLISLSQLFEEEESHFANTENDEVEFAQFTISSYPFRTIQTLFRNTKNFLIDKFSLEEADNILPEYELNGLGNPPSIYETSSEVNASFSQQNKNGDKMSTIDLSKVDWSKIDPNLKTAVEGLQQENQTLTTDLESKKVELQSAADKITAAEKAAIRNEALQFCESEELKLKIIPADKEKYVEFLTAQKEKGTIEFSTASTSSAAGSEQTKIQFNAYDFTKELFKALPDKVELQEIASKDNAKGNSGDDAETLAQKAIEFQASEKAAGRTISASAAVAHVKNTK